MLIIEKLMSLKERGQQYKRYLEYLFIGQPPNKTPIEFSRTSEVEK